MLTLAYAKFYPDYFLIFCSYEITLVTLPGEWTRYWRSYAQIQRTMLNKQIILPIEKNYAVLVGTFAFYFTLALSVFVNLFKASELSNLSKITSIKANSLLFFSTSFNANSN